MKTTFLFLILLCILVSTSFGQGSDNLKAGVSYDVFPIGGMRYPAADTLERIYGMNFNWFGYPEIVKNRYVGFPEHHLPNSPVGFREVTDPLYFDTASTSKPTYSDLYYMLQDAAYGNDIRVYLPGTSGITNEYKYSWNVHRGTDSINQFVIKTSNINSGDTVLSDLGSAKDDPYTPDGYVYQTANKNHIDSFQYDFICYFDPAELASGSIGNNDTLYTLEYWVRSSGSDTYSLRTKDIITKALYNNVLLEAITQAPGRSVGADSLSVWKGQQSRLYKLLRHTLYLRDDYAYSGDDVIGYPSVDVRLRTYKKIPIWVRGLRIRDWKAMRVLGGYADDTLIYAINALLSDTTNGKLKSWTIGNENIYKNFHCWAYINNLLIETGAPVANVLTLRWKDNDNFYRVLRDQTSYANSNTKSGILWDEQTIFTGIPWFSRWVDHEGDIIAHNVSLFNSFDPPSRSLPASVCKSGVASMDSLELYKHGIRVYGNYNAYTTLTQDTLLGYSSEDYNGGFGDYQLSLKYARNAYELDPSHPIPYYLMAQTLVKPFSVPKWSIDSLFFTHRDSLNLYNVNTLHQSSSDAWVHADNDSRDWADSLYDLRIITPYLTAHTTGNNIEEEAIFDVGFENRSPSPAELYYQMWRGVLTGMRGYVINISYTDGLEQHGVIRDTAGLMLKSYEQKNYQLHNDWYLSTPYKGRYTYGTPGQYWRWLPLLPGFAELHNHLRTVIVDELTPIASTLAKLLWKGSVSWHMKDSTPTYLSRIPIKNLHSTSLTGSLDSNNKTYVQCSVFQHPDDTIATYIAIQNRRLWCDALDTLTRDYRTISFQVDSVKFGKGFERYPAWRISDVAGKLHDTVISSSGIYSLVLKPGQGKLLKIEPALEVTLGRMSTNLYNNARHVAPVEDSTGVQSYIATYERDGKIVVSYPTEITEGINHRKTSTPVDSIIDGSGDKYNPAISYNSVKKRIGLIYTSKIAGATADTNLIWYRHANINTPYTFSSAKILDTVIIIRSVDPSFKTTPAVTACFDTGFDFWVSWSAELNKGGVIGLVSSTDALVNNQAFAATLSKKPRFISITSHKHLSGVRMAWEEYNSSKTLVYYSTGTPNLGSITVPAATAISSLGSACDDHHPQIATDASGEDHVVWEAYHSIRLKQKDTSIQRYGYVVCNRARNVTTGKWSAINRFYAVSKSLSTSAAATPVFTQYPSIAFTSALHLSSLNNGWSDFERITWNNKDSAHNEIVHFDNRSWKGAIMRDPSLEPAMAQCIDYELIPDAMLFRDPIHQPDSNYDAKMTRSVFPLTPVREVSSSDLVWKQIGLNTIECGQVIIGNGGGVIFGDGGKKKVVLHPQSITAPTDTIAPAPTGIDTWGGISNKTEGFTMALHDTLRYWRYVQMTDENNPIDTVSYKNSFTDTNDYLKTKINLRKVSDSSLVVTLDTIMLKRNNLSSLVNNPLITKTAGSYIVGSGFTTDSVFLSAETTRGSITNSWAISYIDLYADTTTVGAQQSFKIASRTWSPSNASKDPNPVVSVFPNPFQTSTLITVSVNNGALLNVTLFDALGRRVTELANTIAEKPEYEFTLSGTESISSGKYYLRVQSGNAVVTQQVELLK